MSTTPDIITPRGSTTTGVFADAAGYLSAVEVHDPAPKQSASWSGGTSKTQPERQTLNELHLFAGCGGGILGGILLGHHPVCAVEIEPYCRRVLLQRQRDGVLPRFPIWDDVRTFDGRPWRGRVDVVCGGFPCQDIAVASATGTGLDGERSGLWAEMERIVGEVRPRFVFVENSPAITVRGLGRVLAGLAAMGYHAAWGVLGACDAGAPHERERMWILADANEAMGEEGAGHDQQSRQSPNGTALRGKRAGDNRDLWVALAREFDRMDDGVADRVDRAEALGNGQVPQVAALAWRVLSERVRLRGMRVGLPKGEAVATEGRKDNGEHNNTPTPRP